MNGYTESNEKVKARLERRAMAHQEALAEQLAVEQQRVNSVHYFEGMAKLDEAIRTSAEVVLPPAKMTTLQQLADAKEKSFNQRYYNNPEGKPEFRY